MTFPESRTSLINQLPNELRAVYQALSVDGPPDLNQDKLTLAFRLALAASLEFLVGDSHPSERDVILNASPIALEDASVETMGALFARAHTALEKIEDSLLTAAAPTSPPFRLAVPEYFDDVVEICFRRGKQHIVLFVRVHETNLYDEPIEGDALLTIKSLIGRALSM